MSLQSWNNCPTEILCQIFSKLETTALLTCMKVSSKWKDVAYYIARNQYGGLDKVLNKTLEDGGMSFRKKSDAHFSYSCFNSLLWYNICNAQIHASGPLWDNKIRHMSIYQDNIIIVNNDGVSYFDAEKLNFRRHYDFDCSLFEESDYMVLVQKPVIETKEMNFLIVHVKRNNLDISYPRNPALRVISSNYKFQEDRCYVINKFGHISVLISDRDNLALREKVVARYYGSISNIAAMQVSCDHDLFIILKTGAIFRCDTNRLSPLTKYLNCDLSRSIISFPVTTLHRFGAVFKTAPNSIFDVKYYDETDFMLIQCPGLTCVTDHGNVLFLGFDNGEVKIFIKRRLMKGIHVPELTINVKEYCPRVSSCVIRMIDVYEAITSHILFIATDSVAIKLSIHYPEFKNRIEGVENVEQICLSIIHLLNFE